MSSIDNLDNDLLLDALRKLGITIPDEKPIEVRSVEQKAQREHRYWYIKCEAFETYVDQRDAATPDDALEYACDDTSLQTWHCRLSAYVRDFGNIEEASRNEYVDWLRKHYK
jgi:hypothetical protein